MARKRDHALGSAYDLEPQLLDAKKLARRLDVNPETIRRLVHDKKIPSVRVGSLHRFDLGDVLAALKKS